MSNDSVIQSKHDLDSRLGIRTKFGSSIFKKSKGSMLYRNFLSRSFEASSNTIRSREFRDPDDYLKTRQMELFKTKVDKTFAKNRNSELDKALDKRNFFFKKTYEKDKNNHPTLLPRITKDNYIFKEPALRKRTVDYNGGKVNIDKNLKGIVLDCYLKNLKDNSLRAEESMKNKVSGDNVFTANIKDIGKLMFQKGHDAVDTSNFGFNVSKIIKGKNGDAKKEKVVFYPENLIIKETVVKKSKNLYAKPYTISEFFDVFARVLEDFNKQNKSSSCVPDLATKISNKNNMIASFIDVSSGRVDSGWNKFNIAIETFGKTEETHSKKAALIEKFIHKTIQDLIPNELKKSMYRHGAVKNSYFDNILTLTKKKKNQPVFSLIPNSAGRDDFCQKISRILMEKYIKFTKDDQDNFDMTDIKFNYNNKTENILSKEIITKTDEIYMQTILRTLKLPDSPLKLNLSVDEINKKLVDLVEIREIMEVILLAKRNDYYLTVKNELKDQQVNYKNYSIGIMNNISLTMWGRLDMIETYENMVDKLKLCKVYDVVGSKQIHEFTNDFEDKWGSLDFYENKVRQNNIDINEAFAKITS